MVWAIYLFLIAGHDNRVVDIETVNTGLTHIALSDCREQALALNAYSETPPAEDGLIMSYYKCVAQNKE
ncbi:MAG: hypothetical protein ACPGGG_08260 [Parvibaculales bacterium]